MHCFWRERFDWRTQPVRNKDHADSPGWPGSIKEINPKTKIQTQLLAGAKCRAFFGGRTTVNGVKNNDQQGGSRVGATLAFPVPRNYSVKFYALTGFNADREHDFDAVGIASLG
jgi:hypothetical protein